MKTPKLKIYIKTYGCQMNERDSENVAAAALERGHGVAKSEGDADVIILNTCSVRGAAEEKALGKAGHLCARKNKRGFPIVGVMGCMAQNLAEKILERAPEIDFIAGSRKTPYVMDFVEEMALRRLNGEKPVAAERSKRARILVADAKIDVSDDKESHRLINRHFAAEKSPCAQVSIMQGCAMNCSYCIVPKVRGSERSRPLEEVLLEVEGLASKGVKEITLLGQVVNAYGRRQIPSENGDSPFVRLLKKIEEIKGIERVRFLSPHPAYFRDDLIECYRDLKKLCEYVHLPLQSGSDRVLKDMKRPYRVKRFLEIVEKLRAANPEISISTDVIVGYPSESDADFEETRKVFGLCDFDMAYIFKYSPREGTASALLNDDVTENVKEARNQVLLEMLAPQSLHFNEKFLGRTLTVLVEGRAKRGAALMGRTRSHKKVIFEGDPKLIGAFADVKIEQATVTTIEGVAVSGARAFERP